MSRRPSRPEVLRARELREALRTLLLSNNGIVGDVASATAVLDTAARRAGLAVRFGAGAHLEPCRSGVDAVLGRVLGEVALAMADGRWIRLKACRASDCRWAFFDRARNRSRVWCSMDVCGNRSKGRAYRARAR